MITTFNSCVKSKYCRIGFLTVGIFYFLLKTTNIQNYMIHALKRWRKNSATNVVSSSLEANIAVDILKRKLTGKQVLGLDCEWVSNKGPRQPVAILQLAAPGGFCSIFRLCSLKCIPKGLVDLLENKNILKVGVAVVTDAQYLLADYNVRCKGCVDLRHLAAEVGVEPRGLANLAKDLFGIELNKDWRVRCSDWESETLSPIQIQYAAQDAFIALDIFDALNKKQISKKYSKWKRLFWNKKDYWHHSYNLWISYAEINFKNVSKSNITSQSLKNSKPVNSIIKRNYNSMLVVQKQPYSNIYLLAPNDEVLCTIGTSKASWYIERKLVDIVCDDPKTLKLRFEPAGRATEPEGYNTKPKENKCVVCGSESDLIRKNIVPVEYRKYFKVEMKNHHSHDVLLLCLSCHIVSNKHDKELRDQLVRECEAPLSEGKNSKFREMPDLRALRNAARALYHSGDVLPQARRAHLERVVLDKLGISSDQLDQPLLENIINIDCIVESEIYIPHGQKVVQHYERLGRVDALERRWRQHFLDTMIPHHLPDLWSVNYTCD